ncbi:MAG: helix-turn-helix domain-containing protein, partial [Bdellovibrionales bacterium]|nr:helix-turn-helix domain-containing protein [Bdellovibrionales bacterium]
MPAKAPPPGPQTEKTLRQLGRQIRAHRKGLKVSTISLAEAAGISRMTLNRIEKGESSVTIGAYMNVILALGLKLSLDGSTESPSRPGLHLDSKIALAKYL